MAFSRRSVLAAGGASVFACLSGKSTLAVLEQIVGGERPRRLAPSELAGARADLVAAWSEVRAAGSHGLPAEQHLFLDTATVVDNDVTVTVPPLYHRVVTADLLGVTEANLLQAQADLEGVLSSLEARRLLTFTPKGLGIAVAWGLGYFGRYVKSQFERYAPVDLRLSKESGNKQYAILAAVAFASDERAGNAPIVLEQNDVAFVMASDERSHLDEAFQALFGKQSRSAPWFKITSIREGFVDGRHVGKATESVTKQMATRYRIAGHELIPKSAELFLGFTSTQRTALGPSLICNLETLKGYTDQWPNGYFRAGTTLQVSHIFEDVSFWYGGLSYRQRVGAAFTPSLRRVVKPGTQTVPEPFSGVFTLQDVEDDYGSYQTVGHSTVMQPVSRLHEPGQDNYGRPYRKGTSLLQRADFNTLNNPFAYSSRPHIDGWSPQPNPGLHFLSYAPTSDTFNRIRRAMDGEYPNGTNLHEANSPLNVILTTTHRQNFLVPPRVHRSFPLAEVSPTS